MPACAVQPPLIQRLDQIMKAPEFRFHTRREFLRTSMLGGALAWSVPSFIGSTFDWLGAEARAADHPNRKDGRDSTVLVVVQLAGGNDGLNTVIPGPNDHYLKARPRLGVVAREALKLDDEFGLHPALEGLKGLFDDGLLSVVHGVGYPNPNRSHFRSTEIWQTASDADRSEHYGWLGRYFDHACKGADPLVGVRVGREMPQAFHSGHPVGVCLENAREYGRPAGDGGRRSGSGGVSDNQPAPSMEPGMQGDGGGDGAGGSSDSVSGSSIASVGGGQPKGMSTIDFVERVSLDAQASTEKIRELSAKVTNEPGYPSGTLAEGLKLVARLIGGGAPTRVYYVSQGGYDTHTNQAPAHQRLLTELGGSVSAFARDMRKQGNHERVLLMTFSEFGRRLAENANGGTDHGAAAPLFLVGGGVRPGLHGAFPSLAPTDLLNGDPRFSVDFRSVYAAAVRDWLRAPVAQVLGRDFPTLPLLRSPRGVA